MEHLFGYKNVCLVKFCSVYKIYWLWKCCESRLCDYRKNFFWKNNSPFTTTTPHPISSSLPHLHKNPISQNTTTTTLSTTLKTFSKLTQKFSHIFKTPQNFQILLSQPLQRISNQKITSIFPTFSPKKRT